MKTANESQSDLVSSLPPPQADPMDTKDGEDQVSGAVSEEIKVPSGARDDSSQLISPTTTCAEESESTQVEEPRSNMLIKVGNQKRSPALPQSPANTTTKTKKSSLSRKPKPKNKTANDSPTVANSRQPFHFPPDWNNVGQYKYGTFLGENQHQQNVDETSGVETEEEASLLLDANSEVTVTVASIYTRYRYYDRLFNRPLNCNNNENSGMVMVIPDHVIPWYLRIPKISVPNWRLPEGDDGRQSSIVTVFAIWNMMMGTSLLSLPWAYHHAGLIGGIIVIIAMTSLCFYTANLVLTVPKLVNVQVNEFTDLVSLLLGRVAHKVAQVSSLSIITGGCIVYWILMTNFLRHTISFVYQVQWENATIGMNASSVVCRTALNLADPEVPLEDQSRQSTVAFFAALDYAVPAILVLILGPIMCLRSVSIFLRFNIVGTLSVFFLLGFAFFKAANWGFVHLNWEDPDSPHYVHLFRWNFPIYTGVLSLALFIHNCLTTLLRTQKEPANNGRDLAIAYTLVGVTYLLISTAIYISFPLDKDCLLDNFLDNLESNDLYAFITRLFLLLQVVTLFPLLVYMLRVQVLSLFAPIETPQQQQQLNSQADSLEHRSQLHREPSFGLLRIVLLNCLLLVCCILFATYYPQIGSVIRYCGSFSGLILVFSLPPVAYLRARELLRRPVHPLLFVLLTLIVLFGFANFIAQFLVQP